MWRQRNVLGKVYPKSLSKEKVGDTATIEWNGMVIKLHSVMFHSTLRVFWMKLQKISMKSIQEKYAIKVQNIFWMNWRAQNPQARQHSRFCLTRPYWLGFIASGCYALQCMISFKIYLESPTHSFDLCRFCWWFSLQFYLKSWQCIVVLFVLWPLFFWH